MTGRMLTHDRLTEILSYDPDTGVFTRKVSRPVGAKGTIAGTTNKFGYGRIIIDRVNYAAHRLAWFYMHKEWPKGHIDHKNGKRMDNRIANLRVASQSENNSNVGMRSDNTSGFKGVSFHKYRKKWQAQITFKGRKRCLGYFETPEEGHKAYCKAAEKIHGEFARFK